MVIISKFFNLSQCTLKNSSGIEFSPLISYMNENISKPVTVKELSDMMHLHPNYFIRYFKQYFGCSPIKFFNNLRVEKAKELLTVSSLSVERIGKSIGCSDIYSFSKFFKNSVGMSPVKYRNMY